MRILIDLTSLDDNFSGIERYAYSVTKEMIKNKEHKYILLFKNKIYKGFDKFGDNIQTKIIKGKNKLIFNQIILPFNLLKHKADVYLFFAFPAPFLFFNKKSITTIHDMGAWDCPFANKKMMIWYFKILYWKASLNNKRIITVSEFSKNRIVDILGVNPDNVYVVNSAVADIFKDFKYNRELDEKVKQKFSLPDEYLLSLSTLEPRKNFKLLVKAYQELILTKQIDIDLVLAGRKGWMVDDLFNGVSKEVTDRIHFTGYMEDEELPYIYFNSKCFIFTSLYEGFGLPPLEALTLGARVISSDAASLPEVLGDCVTYFENNDVNSLEEAILKVLKTDGFDNDKIKLWINRYGFDKSAVKIQQIVDVKVNK